MPCALPWENMCPADRLIRLRRRARNIRRSGGLTASRMSSARKKVTGRRSSADAGALHCDGRSPSASPEPMELRARR
eukprot:142360-Prymnesium_polylepis.1